ncbi:hypothetical protein [Novipirellula aureliae]|nr:hypothetical protein [Novipirellula aureliae]
MTTPLSANSFLKSQVIHAGVSDCKNFQIDGMFYKRYWQLRSRSVNTR